jgi:hypothetical protein
MRVFGRRARMILQAALGISLFAVLLGTVCWWAFIRRWEWDPIGGPTDRDWNPESCSSSERFARLNSAGDVATLRESICDWGFGVDSDRYYVFVKKSGEASGRNNLAFRVEASNEDTPPPTVQWISRSRLRIRYAGSVSPVTKQVHQLNGISIELTPSQAYAGFIQRSHGIAFSPGRYSLALITFDLLPLPNSAPIDPLAATGDFSVFGCDHELLAISQPTRDALKSLLRNLKKVRSAAGRYPMNVGPISIQGVAYSSESRNATLRRSDRAPAVRLMYHRFGNTYALELWFPDLQPDFHPPTEHYDSAPATAFVACTAIHFGLATEIRNAGGYVISSVYSQPPILFTPRLGIYTYTP